MTLPGAGADSDEHSRGRTGAGADCDEWNGFELELIPMSGVGGVASFFNRFAQWIGYHSLTVLKSAVHQLYVCVGAFFSRRGVRELGPSPNASQ